MTVAILAFITLFLFMFHELEEIVLVRLWIDKQQGNIRFQRELFIYGKSHYPSTETLAMMILEEFVLASLLLGAGVVFRFSELVLAILLGHTLHLCVHLEQAIHFRTWVPGSRTAALTFPFLVWILVVFFLSQSFNIILLCGTTFLIMVALILNLRFLHRQADRIERILHS